MYLFVSCLSIFNHANTDFKFPPCVELAQTFNGLLTVHHGGHSGSLLHVEKIITD